MNPRTKILQEQEVSSLLSISEAVLRGHFVLRSGAHSDTYINKAAFVCHPQVLNRLGLLLALRFMEDENIDVVVAPAVGAISLGAFVAYHLFRLRNRKIHSIYAEKEGEGFTLNRGYADLVKDKWVLVVEDILTTGGSVRRVMDVVEGSGGNISAVAAICNRGKVTGDMLKPDLDIGEYFRVESLLNVELTEYPEDQCPLCAKNIPINTNVGKGKEFLAKKGRGT